MPILTNLINLTLLLKLLCYCSSSWTAEYLYPVGYNPKQQLYYLLYQTGLDQLQLWSWDPLTKIAFPATLSSFKPAGFQFLPDFSGFSFMDHGLIRVKFYDRRLIKTIELYAPLVNLNSMIWQDSHNFCLCAQFRDSYGIFKVNITNRTPQVTTLLWSPDSDYLYPQIVDSQLFCIKKDSAQSTILSFELNSAPIDPNLTLAALKSSDGKLLFCSFHDQLRPNLKFLKFINATQGFFLTQVPARRPSVVSFDCHSLTLIEAKFLFSFDLPKAYFGDLGAPDIRLHESILPFLPRYTPEKIYFCTQNLKTDAPDLRVDLYSYDFTTTKISQLTQARVNQLFCGLLVLPDSQLCCGGSAIPIHLDDEWGLPKIELPFLT